MPRRLVIAAIAAAGLGIGPAAPRDLEGALAACRAIAAEAGRLACYDRLVAPTSLAHFAGKGSAVTAAFTLDGPARLDFASQDVVMVIYLLDAEGAVVQNLHRAGAGEGSFLIRRPGTYSIQVNATGEWQIEVLPEPAAPQG
ncbi:hypothetical protein [Paracoccus limosus]|uniref:hypothetical protein n=1 Tax=Paracoccus limosus TaxID=913252 RepID=UPI0012B86AD5|nr:hypothetical protein [Paracoccus limosus]